MTPAISRRVRILWLPLSILVVVSACLIGATYFGWQRLAYSEAYRAHRSGDFDQSIKQSKRLLRWGTDHQLAGRIYSLSLAEAGLPAARTALEKHLERYGAEARPEIYFALIEELLEDGELEEADRWIQSRAPIDGGDPAFIMLQAQLLLERGELAEGFWKLEELLLVKPDHPRALLAKGLILATDNSLANRLRAKVCLRRAGEENDEVGLTALMRLAQSPQIPLFPNERQWLIERLRSHPQAGLDSDLAASFQELLINRDEGKRIVSDIIERYGSNDPGVILDWLLRVGAVDAADRFLQSGDGARIVESKRVEAMLQMALSRQDRSTVRRILEENPDLLDEHRRAFLMVGIDLSKRTGPPPPEPTELWHQAFELHVEKPGAPQTLVGLADLGAGMGWFKAAEKAYSLALERVEEPIRKADILQKQLGVAFELRDSDRAIKVLDLLIRIDPDNLIYKNNLYYFEALRGGPVSSFVHALRSMVDAAPNSQVASTYAFALWRAGRNEEAIEVFQQLDPSYYSVSACSLLGGLIWLEEGHFQRAGEFLRNVDRAALWSEESELFDQAWSALPDEYVPTKVSADPDS